MYALRQRADDWFGIATDTESATADSFEKLRKTKYNLPMAIGYSLERILRDRLMVAELSDTFEN